MALTMWKTWIIIFVIICVIVLGLFFFGFLGGAGDWIKNIVKEIFQGGLFG